MKIKMKPLAPEVTKAEGWKNIEGEVMNKVVEILMRRDGLTEKEAEDLIIECREELESGNYEAIQEVLGLEDDYIFEVLL